MTMPIVPIAPLPPDSGDVFIVQVKKSFIRALSAAFNGYHTNSLVKNININMEYPAIQEHYPAIWVQFSLRDLQKFGISADYRDENDNRFQQWQFSGRITLNVLGLSSKERDEISSEIIQVYAFSRVSPNGKRFRNSLHAEKYLNVSFDEDKIDSGGQSVTVGTAWSPDQLVYEDNYSFSIIGQFRSTFDRDERKVVLSSIISEPFVKATEYSDSGITFPLGDGEWI